MTETDTPPMTTRGKLLALAEHLRTLPTDHASPESRGLVEMVQIAEGFGLEVWEYVIPESDAEADLAVDQLIALLLNLRGDDLPPFDLERYGELVDDDGEA